MVGTADSVLIREVSLTYTTSHTISLSPHSQDHAYCPTFSDCSKGKDPRLLHLPLVRGEHPFNERECHHQHVLAKYVGHDIQCSSTALACRNRRKCTQIELDTHSTWPHRSEWTHTHTHTHCTYAHKQIPHMASQVRVDTHTHTHTLYICTQTDTAHGTTGQHRLIDRWMYPMETHVRTHAYAHTTKVALCGYMYHACNINSAQSEVNLQQLTDVPV